MNDTLDPISLNVAGVQSLIGSKLNKSSSGVTGQDEGVQSEKIDVLELNLDDEELLALSKKWEQNYSPYEAKIKVLQMVAKTYYLGLQKDSSDKANPMQIPIADNLIFEAVETFIPATLAKNPEPVVFSDETPEGQAICDSTKAMLEYHADVQNMRGQLTMVVRKWSIDKLGVMKTGWDDVVSDIQDDIRDAKDFVFDTEGYVDMNCDFIGYLGERVTVSARQLVELFPKAKAHIVIMCEGKMGTRCTYTEWWNDDYTFTTFKGKILDKSKNPHFNYKKSQPNHFGRSKKPYTFFSVFSFQDQPHDVTGLIEQNISNQKVITRRSDQIDFNLSRQNNSDVFSANNWTQETAKQAANAIKAGHPVIVPAGGPIAESIHRLQAQGLDAGFFNDLESRKEALRSSFGTQGITSKPPEKDETATGIMLDQQRDTSRISGGIGDALERFAKAIFNQHVQFYQVYYTQPHEARILGQMKAVEYQKLSQDDFMMDNGLPRRIVVTVAPDSMKAHDPIQEANQAMNLLGAEMMDPKTLLTRINFPDPQGTAEQIVLWKMSPQLYVQKNFPELAQLMSQNQQPNPEEEQMKAEIQMKQQESQLDMQSKQQEMQLKKEEAQMNMQIKAQEAQQKIQLEREGAQNKIQVDREMGQQKVALGQEMSSQKIKQSEESFQSKVALQKKQAAMKPKKNEQKQSTKAKS